MKFPRLARRDGGMRIWISTLVALAGTALGQVRDTLPDTWVGADGLGRVMPGAAEAGPPREGKTVAMFYFLWLGAHENGGPYDITKILQQDPQAMQKPDSPLWGPMFAPHHWGEPHLGYYRTDDRFVLAKHARMLADAGVDTLVFDVTNQATYTHEYRTLLEVFAEVRKQGGRTPQVAFLCPFWKPEKVVRTLYRDLYSKGEYADLLFKLDGKPFILADPLLLARKLAVEQHDTASPIAAGAVEGQTFTLTQPAASVAAAFATWGTKDAGITLTLRGEDGAAVLSQTFTNIPDNGWMELHPDKPFESGTYNLEASSPAGQVGWWRHASSAYAGGTATVNGAPVEGDRMFRAALLETDGEMGSILDFFTFRSPQPDYFQGPAKPDMWSWLEVYPQHLFRNSRGEAEMMSVGVAQNAVGGRLGSLSEAGARGRTFHQGARDTGPDAVGRGLNFAEQWSRVREVDPATVFVTGWNEWIAGRHPEFAGVREPVMFVDQFNEENSRDIEPMRGGFGDHYYYQLISEVRKFKGVRPVPPAGPEKTILPDAGFLQWSDVTPVFLDDLGDTGHRDHPGYAAHRQYTNTTGRNDIVECRVARDEKTVWFYVKAGNELADIASVNGMRLLLDTDSNPATGWHGYDYNVNSGILEKWSGKDWAFAGDLKQLGNGNEFSLAVPRDALGLPSGTEIRLDFKWTDHIPMEAGPLDWIDTGDTAPNGRLNYRFTSK